ncbi:hypothetical protein SAMN06265338_1741 [Rhodoblastus acidophilus]|uniref:Uncharacterized protein n=1 Tax=Rhodoblastus acidophilus TaxID=1074 RepID=A0A212SII6_RHOAC|nr:hypothetical protein SAMN06265338_1741 [Rhodoblastus acidophilus]
MRWTLSDNLQRRHPALHCPRLLNGFAARRLVGRVGVLVMGMELSPPLVRALPWIERAGCRPRQKSTMVDFLLWPAILACWARVSARRKFVGGGRRPEAWAPTITLLFGATSRLAATRLLCSRLQRRLLGHADLPNTGEDLPEDRRVWAKIQKRLLCAARLGLTARRAELDGVVRPANRVGPRGEDAVAKALRRQVQENDGLLDVAAVPFSQELLRDSVQEPTFRWWIDESGIGAPRFLERRVAFGEETTGSHRAIGVHARKRVEADAPTEGVADPRHIKWWRPEFA